MGITVMDGADVLITRRALARGSPGLGARPQTGSVNRTHAGRIPGKGGLNRLPAPACPSPTSPWSGVLGRSTGLGVPVGHPGFGLGIRPVSPPAGRWPPGWREEAYRIFCLALQKAPLHLGEKHFRRPGSPQPGQKYQALGEHPLEGEAPPQTRGRPQRQTFHLPPSGGPGKTPLPARGAHHTPISSAPRRP